jgi:hypothetical protein
MCTASCPGQTYASWHVQVHVLVLPIFGCDCWWYELCEGSSRAWCLQHACLSTPKTRPDQIDLRVWSREWLLTFGLGIIIIQGVSSRKSLTGVNIMWAWNPLWRFRLRQVRVAMRSRSPIPWTPYQVTRCYKDLVIATPTNPQVLKSDQAAGVTSNQTMASNHKLTGDEIATMESSPL